MKKILLTGSTGFLGSALLHGLLSNGYSVIGIKRSTSDMWRISHLTDHNLLTLVDIDQCNIENIFKENNIETIIHTATEYGREIDNVSKILEANLMLPLKIAEAGIANGTTTFINTDSYFNKINRSYTHLLNYSLSKKSLQIWLENISNKLKIVNIYLEHIYGPKDSKTKFVDSLINDIIHENNIQLTHGHQKRDFIYIDDAVSAYLKIIEHSKTHQFKIKQIELGSGKSIPIREFAKRIKLICNSKSKLEFGAIDYRPDEIMESVANTKEITEMGWKPFVNIEGGIKSIVAYKRGLYHAS